MATRLYIESSVVGVPPAIPYSSGWDRLSPGVRRQFTTKYKLMTASVLPSTGVENLATKHNALMYQMITPRLRGDQTIAGTIKGIIRALQNSAAADFRPQLRVYVANGSDLSVRGVLWELDNSDSLTSEFGTGNASRKWPAGWVSPGATLSSVDALDGDYVVIEWGVRVLNVSTSNMSDGFEIGTFASDRPEDETTTTAGLSPWFEFSQDLVFVNYAQVGAVSAQLLITAQGPARLGAESAQFLITAKGPARLGAESAQFLITAKGPARLGAASVQMLITPKAIGEGQVRFGPRLVKAPPPVITPEVNGYSMYIPDNSEFVPWPAGSVSGDLIVVQAENGWNVDLPAGWSQHYYNAPSQGSGMLMSKQLSQDDVTLGAPGGFTLTASGGSFPGAVNVVRVHATKPSVRTFTGGYSGSGYTSLPLSSPVPLVVGELLLWLTAKRANDSGLSLNRAAVALGFAAAGANGSAKGWYEFPTTTDSINAIFTGSTGGANNITQAVVVSLTGEQPPPPTPLNTLLPTISGLVLDMDADGVKYQDVAKTIPVANANEPVGSWVDAVAARAAEQGTAGARPLWIPNAYNGKSTIRFDGGDDQLILPAHASEEVPNPTIFVVAKAAATGGRVMLAKSHTASGWSSPYARWIFYINGTSFDIRWNGAQIVAGNWTTGDLKVLELVDFDVVANGVQQVDGTDADLTYPNSGSPIYISGNGVGSERFSGDISRILIFNRVLTATERSNLRRSLGAYYGLTI